MSNLAQAVGADSVPQHFIGEQPNFADSIAPVASTRVLKLFGQVPDPFRPSQTLCLQPSLLNELAEFWHDPIRFAATIGALLNGEARAKLHPEVAAELARLQTYYVRQRMLASAWASARAGSAGPWSI